MDAALVSILSALVGGTIGVGGLLLKSWLDKTARADAMGTKLLEAKLDGYERLQVALDAAFLAILDEIRIKGLPHYRNVASGYVPVTDGTFGPFWTLRQTELPFVHVFSARVAESLSNFHSFRAEIAQKDKGTHTEAEEERAIHLLNEIRNAIRADCQTDRLDRHREELLNREPMQLIRQWLDQLEKDTSLGPRVAQGGKAGPDGI